MLKLRGISGSLRAASGSTALLAALGGRLEGRVDYARLSIGDLPHYNADNEGGAAVDAFIQGVRQADGLVFVTPEYNFSIPGVLKNAIDWASRPAYQSVFKGKPCFVISTSGGALGGVRAQAHLKYILNGMLAEVFTWQEIVVPHAPAKLQDGVFADQAVLDFAMAGLDAFVTKLAAAAA